MKRIWRYYEAHLTILGMNEELLSYDSLLTEIKSLGLKPVDLVNIRREDLENEEFDLITTLHSPSLKEITAQTIKAVTHLKEKGYPVVRYKIESAVFDSKYEDTFNLL